MSDEADWVTAAATTATGLFAAMGFWISLVAYRRTVNADLPRIEPTLKWVEDKEIGPSIEIELLVVNRIDETLVIDKIELKRPKKARLHASIEYVDDHGYQKHKASVVSARAWEPKASIYSAGTTVTWVSAPARADMTRVYSYISCPIPPSRQLMVLHVFVSTKTTSIRERRIVVRSIMPPRTSNASDVAASSQT